MNDQALVELGGSSTMDPMKSLSAALVTELALGLSDRREILERHGVSESEWEALRHSQAFRTMLAEAASDWGSDLNAPRRTRLKAQILTEDGLVQLDQIVHDAELPPASRIEAAKLLARIAGLQETETAQGSNFSVAINIGGGKDVVIAGGEKAA